MSAALWILVGLPAAGALAAALLPRLRAPIAQGTGLVVALWALAAVVRLEDGASAMAPWVPSRGLELRLLFEALAIPGVLLTAAGTLAAVADRRTPSVTLPGLLVGASLVLTVWLAGDLGLLVAALGGLGLLAALLARGRGPAAVAVALPLGVATAAIAVGVLLLVLQSHEAASGALWIFERLPVVATTTPPGVSTPATVALVLGAWLLAGTWPLDGWWRAAARAAPPGVAAWLPAMIRPLGLWVLLRVAMPAGGAVLLAAAPVLAWIAALGVTRAALAAFAEAEPRARAMLLAELPIGLAMIGAWTVSAEGTAGALLLGVAGGLALPLALPGGGSGPADPPARARQIGLLGLAGAPGLVGGAGALLVLLAVLGQGRWFLAGAPWIAGLVLVSTGLGIAAALRRSPAAGPRSGGPVDADVGSRGSGLSPRTGHGADARTTGGSAGSPRRDAGARDPSVGSSGQDAGSAGAGARELGADLSPRTGLEDSADGARGIGHRLGRHLGAIALVIALVALGLRPAWLLDRVAPASAAWMGEVYGRVCVDLLAPVERATLGAPPAACEAPIPAVRAHLQEATP